MDKLINFAVNLMERENYDSRNWSLCPSQNSELNPEQNPDINTSQNHEINETQNLDIAPSQNPSGWKKEQWELFKGTVLWNHLDEDQRQRCREFLKRL